MMTDFETWMMDYGLSRIFRLSIRKTLPPEMQHEHFVIIKEAIELPDKDLLIGFQEIMCWEDLSEEEPVITYEKLSNVRLRYYPEDNVEENWD